MTTPEFDRDRYSTVKMIETILLAHIDGTTCGVPPKWSHERMVTRLLIDRNMLEPSPPGFSTKITERGRAALAKLLAQHADRLMAAHLAQIDNRADRLAKRARVLRDSTQQPENPELAAF